MFEIGSSSPVTLSRCHALTPVTAGLPSAADAPLQCSELAKSANCGHCMWRAVHSCGGHLEAGRVEEIGDFVFPGAKRGLSRIDYRYIIKKGPGAFDPGCERKGLRKEVIACSVTCRCAPPV